MVRPLSFRSYRTRWAEDEQKSYTWSDYGGRAVTLRVVRLGEPRDPHEGIRVGTVRRPPRGVRKEHYASGDWFDVWYPDLAPSEKLMKQGKTAATDFQWKRFVRAFKAEMNAATASRTLDLLAALSHKCNLSIGCYCENEARCHRSVLRELLEERGAALK
jgi:uncharacterized protein YeaO (DUF488 family)